MVVCFIIPPLLSGCASSGDRSSLSAKTGGVMADSEREIELGKQVAQEVVRRFPAYESSDVNHYLNQIGQRLVAESERTDIAYRFTVLDEPAINAFATPGGNIFITRGLLTAAKNEAQVAGVVAHEIGHVVERHSMKQYQASILAQIAGVAGAMAAGGSPAAGPVMVDALMRGYSREYEYRADALGVKYMYKAGYDPNELLAFFETLQEEQKFLPTRSDELKWTHPATPKRIENAKQAIQNLKLWEMGVGAGTVGRVESDPADARRELTVGAEPYEQIMAVHSFDNDKAAVDKVFTLVQIAYEAQDSDKLMAYVSREMTWGKMGYHDFDQFLRDFFTRVEKIQVKTEKKRIGFKTSELAWVYHVYAESFVEKATGKRISNSERDLMWFVRKNRNWLLVNIQKSPDARETRELFIE